MNRIARVDVAARTAGQSFYATFPLRAEQNEFHGDIPAAFVIPPVVEYYIRAQLRGGGTITLPETSPEDHPFVVEVDPQDPSILVLAPDPGEQNVEPRTQIAALFNPPLEPASEARMLLDNQFVATDTTASGDYISFVPSNDLLPGRHVVRVEVTTGSGSGQVVRSRTWSFVVLRQTPGLNEKPSSLSRLSGQLSVGVEYDTGNDEQIIAYYFPQPPGTHLVLEGDLSTVSGGQTLSLWVSSMPGFFPRTQGAVLLSGAVATCELGTLSPIVSEIALSGPVATGVRIATPSATGSSASFYTLYTPRSAEVLRYASYLSAINGAVGPSWCRASGLALYGIETGTQIPGALPTRSGWTVCPRLLAGTSIIHVDTQIALAQARTRDGTEIGPLRAAKQVELTANASIGHASLRYTSVPKDYVALGAPYLQSDRREAYGTATLGTVPGFVGSATYRVAQFNTHDTINNGWSHKADASVSYIDRAGQAATFSVGSFDQSSYVSGSAILIRGQNRLTVDLSHSSTSASHTISGSLAVRGMLLQRGVGEAGLTFSRVVEPAALEVGQAQGNQFTSGEVTPYLRATWQMRPSDAIEIFGSVSSRHSLIVNEDLRAEVVSFRQETVRISYIRSW
jgi:hypothetical protein